jgi:CheY-like chemotaxis protein
MKTLLIIDDEADLIEALTTFLEPEGYRVLPAINGKAALEIIQGAERVPDLILLDLMMPEVSGFDVLRALRKKRAYRQIPVLLMSATYAPIESAELKGIPFIRKPFDLSDLIAMLSELLKIA